MALNKFMHPRNIYKVPPDFGRLAKQDPEFSAIAKVDVSGKVTIDFKDANSLRILTKCLLQTDFNLNIEIPEDRLVPTLPLRLNYILWVEDLLTSIQRNSDVSGLDIGTGACAIYPLLAAVKNKWHMVGTEKDSESLSIAKENVERNNLQDHIKLIENKSKSIISHVFTVEKPVFDFCMCNPPFYSNVQELCESRSPARLPPKNGFTGSPQELITEGGELEFCRKLIRESREYKDNILIFTTMVGHKYNLYGLIQDLKSENTEYTHTEFCQGRVTRWGLAWTYKEYEIHKLVPPRDKLRKKHTSTVYILPELPNCNYNMKVALDKIKDILTNLSIRHTLLDKRGNNIVLEIEAHTNTWSNQRRKRRLEKRKTEQAKRSKLDSVVEESKSESNAQINSNSCELVDPVVEESKSESNAQIKSNSCELIDPVAEESKSGSNSQINSNSYELIDPVAEKSKSESNSQINSNSCELIDPVVEESRSESNTQIHSNSCELIDPVVEESKSISNAQINSDSCKLIDSVVEESKSGSNAQINSNSGELSISSLGTSSLNACNSEVKESRNCSTKEPLVHAFFKLFKKDSDILLEVEFLDGSSGKEGIHQILQYIKNNWK